MKNTNITTKIDDEVKLRRKVVIFNKTLSIKAHVTSIYKNANQTTNE